MPPRHAAQGPGAIVTMSSSSALTGGTSGAHYAAAKGGVLAVHAARWLESSLRAACG
jgi:NAD(P)-dependent dehydrogenase (short-subunit alcohol dehydrogenase family)